MTIYMSLFGEQFPITVEKAVTPNLVLIGTALCTTYALPFEFSSILLLAAVVGAIMLAKNESKMAPDEDDEYDDDTDGDAGNSQEFKLKRDTDAAAAASTSR
jgi:hypothetical protein